MKLYNSYIKKKENEGVEDIVFIKNGFSFTAFFFNILWFAYHKMTKGIIALLVIDWVLIELMSLKGSGSLDFLIIFLSTSLIMAANANLWYSKYLKAQGYQFMGCIFGENKEAAKLRFVEGYLDKYGDEAIKKHTFLKEDKKSNK